MLYAGQAKKEGKTGKKRKNPADWESGPAPPFRLPCPRHVTRLRSFCGNVREKTQAVALIGGVTAERLLADRGQDSDAIFEQAAGQGMSSLIVPRGRRKGQRGDDKEAVQGQALTALLPHLKRWRGIVTRYAKHTASLPATLHSRRPGLWLQSRDCAAWPVGQARSRDSFLHILRPFWYLWRPKKNGAPALFLFPFSEACHVLSHRSLVPAKSFLFSP